MAEVRRSNGFPLSIATLSDVGRVRTNNEDSFGTAWLQDGSLFIIVADGMGGHEAGEVASGLAVRVVEEAVGRDPEGDPRERLYNALLEANEAILSEANHSGMRGMGTTAISILLRGPEGYVGQVGDSRCYQIRRGHVIWRTADHTRVQMLVDNGEISEEESRNHPEAGMLTRALGHARMADGRPLEPDVLAEPVCLQESDTLILCSDGLHDLIEDWEIGQVVAGKSGEEAAEALVDLACERGGHDNVTVAVVTAGTRGAAYDESYVPETWEDEAAGSGEAYGDLGANAEDTFEEERQAAAAAAAAAAPMIGGPIAMAQMAPEPAPRSNTGMIIGVVVVLLLLLGFFGAVALGLIAFFMM